MPADHSVDLPVPESVRSLPTSEHTPEPRRTLVDRLADSALLGRLPAGLRTSFMLNNVIYFGGNMFAGLAGFLFQSLLAGALGKDRFAEVGTLLAILYLIQILLYVAMAVAARYTAPLAATGDQSRVNRAYIDFTVYASVGGVILMAAFIALAPQIRAFLQLPGLGPLIALSAALPLCLILGVARGVVQGEERFLPLSSNFVLYGATTLACLPLVLHYNLRAVGAIVAVNLAVCLCVLLAAITLRDLPHAAHHERLSIWPMIRSALGASAGITAITLFYNVDVLLASHFLPDTTRGDYVAMNLLGRILFFGTISVSAVMFPRVAALHAEGKSPKRVVNLSLGLVLFAGGLVTLVYFFLPHVVITLLLHKPEFQAIAPYLGIFGLGMLGLAIANVLMYYFVAVHLRRFAWSLAIGGITFLVVLSLFHADLAQFTWGVAGSIDLTAFLLLATYLFWDRAAELFAMLSRRLRTTIRPT